MPAHDEALNDLSLMPPVSVTMQPRNLLRGRRRAGRAGRHSMSCCCAGGAELVLLPHAAMTSVADTASAAVAHALCFTLTSTGPARRSAWPRIRPGLSRRLCLVASPGKGTRGYLACSLPNRNPIMMALLACQTDTRGSATGLGAFLQAEHVPTAGQRCLRRALSDAAVAVRRRHAGEVEGRSARRLVSRSGRAVPPLEVTSRCTMARPSPVPFGFEVVNRRKARSRSSALMPGPSSADGDPGAGRRDRRGDRDVAARAQRVQRVGDQVVQDLLQVALADPGQHRCARPARCPPPAPRARCPGRRPPGATPRPAPWPPRPRPPRRAPAPRSPPAPPPAGRPPAGTAWPARPARRPARGRGGRVGVRGEQVQPQPQRGQRGAQLMRHVRDHGPVAVHQGLQPPGHGVERRPQPAQLRRSRIRPRPGGQVAVGQPRAAASSPASGLLTHRASANASSAAAEHGHDRDRAEDDPQRRRFRGPAVRSTWPGSPCPTSWATGRVDRAWRRRPTSRSISGTGWCAWAGCRSDRLVRRGGELRPVAARHALIGHADLPMARLPCAAARSAGRPRPARAWPSSARVSGPCGPGCPGAPRATAASVLTMSAVSWMNELRSCAIVFSASGTTAPASTRR